MASASYGAHHVSSRPRRVAALLAAVVITVASAGREPLCPAGYYRESVLVWPCEALSANTQFDTAIQVGLASIQELGEIPSNLTHPAIRVKSAKKGKLVISSPADKGRNILVSQQGKLSYPWSNLTLTEHLVSFEPFEESAELFGVTPSLLNVSVENTDSTEAVFNISYSHEGYHNGTCPSTIPGCARHNASISALAVDKFSAYMMLEYNDFFFAWTSMPSATPSSETSVSKLNVDRVSWYQWKTIWHSRPSPGISQTEWKETFLFVDSLIKTDGFISRAEFRKAFNLHKAYASLCAWSSEIHGAVNGKTAEEAWAAISDGAVNISHAVWKGKWEAFLMPSTLKRASTEDVLPYFDVDGDGAISQAEFSSAYETYYNGTTVVLGLAGLQHVTTITTTQAASTQGSSTDASASRTCWLPRTRYHPSLSGVQRSKEANVKACQLRCKVSGAKEGCAHFAFWSHSRECEMYGENATAVVDFSAIAGPAACGVQGDAAEGASSGSGGLSGSEDGSSSGQLLEGGQSTSIVALVAALVCIVLVIFLVLFLLRKGPFESKAKGAKTFKRDPKTQSREVSGFYEPVTPSEVASGVGDGSHLLQQSERDDYQQSPASLQPVANAAADAYYPGPYEQSAQPSWMGGAHTPLSSVSLTPPQSKHASSSSWNQGQGYGAATAGGPSMGATPLRYSMPGSPQSSYCDERYGGRNNSIYPPTAYGDQANQQQPQSFTAGAPNTGYLSAQSSFSAGAPPYSMNSLTQPMSSTGNVPMQPDYFGSFRLGQPASFAQPYIGPV